MKNEEKRMQQNYNQNQQSIVTSAPGSLEQKLGLSIPNESANTQQ